MTFFEDQLGFRQHRLTKIPVLQAMQVQNMVWAPAVITVLTALANIPINMLLIAWYDFWGAALATSVARILQLVLLCGTSSTVVAGQRLLCKACRHAAVDLCI